MSCLWSIIFSTPDLTLSDIRSIIQLMFAKLFLVCSTSVRFELRVRQNEEQQSSAILSSQLKDTWGCFQSLANWNEKILETDVRTQQWNVTRKISRTTGWGHPSCLRLTPVIYYMWNALVEMLFDDVSKTVPKGGKGGHLRYHLYLITSYKRTLCPDCSLFWMLASCPPPQHTHCDKTWHWSAEKRGRKECYSDSKWAYLTGSYSNEQSESNLKGNESIQTKKRVWGWVGGGGGGGTWSNLLLLSCLFHLDREKGDWLRPQLFRIATNKVALDMMKHCLQMEDASCFHRVNARNCNNAGNVVVLCRWKWWPFDF